MTIEQFVADAKAKAIAVETALKDFFTANPQVAQVVNTGAASTVDAGIADLKNALEATVEKDAPAIAPTADAILNAASAAIDTKLAADIAALTETANTAKAALVTSAPSIAAALASQAPAV